MKVIYIILLLLFIGIGSILASILAVLCGIGILNIIAKEDMEERETFLENDLYERSYL